MMPSRDEEHRMWNDEQHRRGDLPSQSYVPGIGGVFEPEYLLNGDHEVHGVPDETWDRRALHHIETHLHAESEVVAGYEELLGEASGAVAYLIQLIVADEYRHHHLLAELAKAVGAAAGRPGYLATEIPVPEPLEASIRARLLVQTQKFIEVERDDAKELREILRDLRPTRTRTIWPLLVELMELDSEKHTKILHRIEHLLSQFD
jgi:hypothetical protein